MLSKIFWLGVAFFIPTVTLLYVDIAYGLAVSYWWLDNFLHLLGGALAGLIGVWWGLMITSSPKRSHALLGALILGGLVEALQLYTGTGLSPYLSVPIDTTKDIILDLLGGYAAWRIVRTMR